MSSPAQGPAGGGSLGVMWSAENVFAPVVIALSAGRGWRGAIRGAGGIALERLGVSRVSGGMDGEVELAGLSDGLTGTGAPRHCRREGEIQLTRTAGTKVQYEGWEADRLPVTSVLSLGLAHLRASCPSTPG